MPNFRHETILQLIQSHNVTTQEMLRELLEQEGYSVTQATISRDIRQLNLRKKRNSSGLSVYVRSHNLQNSPNNLLNDVVLRVDHAMNTVVVSCHPGSAQAACAILDSMQMADVVGTIAGDDTIFILTRSETSAKQLVHILESQIWG
ncbi:MAG: ArgR family transcriptional regulator [Oscillospiraceae bacterium]|nr:ArgR family transcriptional regulator [Oscillospiraceae bacterium]